MQIYSIFLYHFNPIANSNISLIQRPHYITSSYTYQFFEKSYFIIVLQKISCTRQFESQLSLRSFALSFRVKDCLSTLLQRIGFLYIVTWKHRLIVLIPIFHAGKTPFSAFIETLQISFYFLTRCQKLRIINCHNHK